VGDGVLQSKEKITGEVCTIIVTYNAEASLIEDSIRRLRQEGVLVVVVDNGSSPSAVAGLQQVIDANQADMIVLPKNLGLAAAQNLGIRHAQDAGAQFVLLLDHDSLIEPGMVQAQLQAYEDLVARGVRVAALGPMAMDARTKTQPGFVKLAPPFIKRLHFGNDDKNLVEADFLNASGSLIPIQALHDIGLMNEGYFIDHVDTEWCLRAIARGYCIYGVCNARLLHRLGDNVIRIWFGRWREVSVHAPRRHYFVFRNTLLMLRTTPMPFTWRLTYILRLIQFLIFFAFVVPPRLQRLRFMALGILDGLRVRVGSGR
jgi:rhamnosyltransferase